MQTQTEIADVLEKAADLIEPEGAWCQGANALKLNGQVVCPNSDAAVRWCAVGAITHMAGDVAREVRVWRIIEKIIPGGSVPIWNDDPNRTQPEVVAALRTAAALARAS